MSYLIAKLIRFRRKDLDYLRRRALAARLAGRPNATVTGQVRQALDESHALRHDLRQPLNTILLAAELLQKKGCEPLEAAYWLKEAARQWREIIERYERQRSDVSADEVKGSNPAAG